MRRTRFSNPEHTHVLGSPDWSHCEALIGAFEEAWRRGSAPAIPDYLKATGSARQALLLELVHIELEFRIKAGESARVETYLTDYPELTGNHPAILDLIIAEFDLRRRHQGDVGRDEYFLRFPDYQDDLPTRLVFGEGDTPYPGGTKTPTVACWRPDVPGYEFVGEIGRGGMGVVYKARESSLGRYVALKFLPAEYARDPERLERFRREARTASALNHPHICTVHALGEHAGRPFIVMEFVDGLTLHALAASRPAVAEVTRLVRQAARALAAAHAAGVVHRDIKPENIMVREDGYVKVLDFGLARRLPTLVSHEPGCPDTDPGALLGTVAYMSPEQARGEPAGSASDIFALGVVLYELATGRHPFDADSAHGTLHAIVTSEPLAASQLNPEVPFVLEELLRAMLHKDARLRPTAAEVEAALTGESSVRGLRVIPPPAPRPIVHREAELTALRAALSAASAGRGSLVCVAGEPGIGKTTLIEDFLERVVAADRSCLVARGHCSERLAGSEAYLPVIDALADLLRGPAGPSVARLMKVIAPTWYAQASGVTSRETGMGPQAPDASPTPPASSQPAMLREFCQLLQEASRLGPVVLFFDDVHWADLSTVDLLAHLGRQSPGLRVLAIVTYRPTELLLGPHPFQRVRRELQAKGSCSELALGFLDRQYIDRYLALAFPGHAFPMDFADLIHARTEGNPLFMVDLLRYLRERGAITQAEGYWSLARALPDLRHELPESVRGLIQMELERLGHDDRRLIAAAAVQGQEFDSTVVADALGRDPAEVEERLQSLERVHGLVRLTREYEFPDRTLTQRYAFVHALYQEALYAELSPARRASLGAALARSLEARHADGSHAVAAELACLYEVGRNFGRAARQFWLAAQNAVRFFAHREAVVLARRGLRLLAALPETPERAALELPLQTTLGLQLQVTEGYAAPAAERAYVRARALSEAAGPGAQFPVFWGLWLYAKVRSELAKAGDLAGALRALARQLGDPNLELQAQQALTVTALCRGEPAAAWRHTEQGAALYDPRHHGAHSFQFGQDPGVACKAFGAVALWLLGYPDEARRQSTEAVRLGHSLSHPNSQALALHFAAMLHQLCRDGPATHACADACGAIAAEHGFSFWLAGAFVMGGWAQALSAAPAGGIDLLRQGLRQWVQTGSVTYQTYYLGLLAEMLVRHGATEEAGRVLEEALALAARTGEGLYEAELYRLRGERRRSAGAVSTGPPPEEDFRQALAIARRQEAKSLELRAALSLARLRCDPESRGLLAAIYGRFTEGFETPDLADARALLDSPV